jgi:hypothetical protein
MAIATNFQVTASRALPQSVVDTSVINARGSRYGDVIVENVWPTSHVQADEGSYFFANNAQTGIATTAAPTAFSATNPFIALLNNDTPNNPAAKRIFIDYITLLNTAIGTGAASVQAAISIDAATRYTSGGSTLTTSIYKANGAGPASIAALYAGNLTIGAATNANRPIVGQRYLKGAIPVAGDTYTLSFGSVDQTSALQASTITYSLQGFGPIILNPGEAFFLHLWFPSQSGASSYAPEIGWSER